MIADHLVAPAAPGAILIGPAALRHLTRHLEHCRLPADDTGRRIVRQIIALSRPSPVVPADVARLPIIEPPSTVSTADAARYYGITTDAVRKRIARGRLNAWHDGRTWRIPADQLEEQ